ncbi:hypothetical protein AB0I53_19755 [Saccharopolyspora sp. NPDC050389]|uniref:hypothetical protein n=1 Tax=Saccharopolyspora sp. NPDC050389 TaxID=3155516 RepID=UPI003410002B
MVSRPTDVPRAGYTGMLASGGLGLAGLITLALVVALPVVGLRGAGRRRAHGLPVDP